MNPGRQRGRGTWTGSIEDWNELQKYAEEGREKRVANQLVSAAQRWGSCLLKRDFSLIQSLPDTLRPNALKGLSLMAKYLGVYDEFKADIKKWGLKWTGRSADDVFIDRYLNVSEADEIWNWVKQVKTERAELSDFMDLMSISGLRFVEGFRSYNLIIELSRAGKLYVDREGKNYRGGYYNRELQSLEHFWQKDENGKSLFLRPSKKAFISFVPEDIVAGVAKHEHIVSTDAIQSMVRKRGLPLRFSDIREAMGTAMVGHLKSESEVNFINGRITRGVFMSNYFNAALVTDLQTRVFQGIAEIQQKVKT